LCLELSLLLHAGVGVGDGLSLLAEEETSGSLRPLLSSLAQQVDDGVSLAAALQQSGRFPDYVWGLLEIGERSGRMEETLTALARHYEDRARLDRRLRSALLYPAVLLIIMLAVIVVLLTQVLPIFNQVYADLGGRLTGIAGGLLALGRGLDQAMPLLCILLGAVVLFLALFAASDAFRNRMTGWWQRHWGDKGVSRQLSTARFAQSMTMGLGSGLPLEESISLSAKMLSGIPAAQARCKDCLDRLDQGVSLSKAMSESGVLPAAQCRLLELGVRGGSGDTAMEEISRRLSEESELALEERVGQIEPMLVIVTSVLVGIILLSVMLPLLHIMSAIG
jgi:type IV pilus assembly protein PilC